MSLTPVGPTGCAIPVPKMFKVSRICRRIRYYFNQPPALLKWALTRALDRVMYAPLTPRRPDFELVQQLMIESGVLERRMELK